MKQRPFPQARIGNLKRRSVVYALVGGVGGLVVMSLGWWFEVQHLNLPLTITTIVALYVYHPIHVMLLGAPIVFMLLGLLIGRLIDLEQQSVQQRDFWYHVIDLMGEGITFVDNDRTFQFVNRRYAEMLGSTQATLIGKSPFDFTVENDQDLLMAAWRTRLEGNKSRYLTRLRRVSDQQSIDVLITGVPWVVNEQMQGSIAVIHDMTEEVRLQRELEAEHAFIQTVLDTADVLVLVCSSHGIIRSFNRACQMLTGYDAEQVIGTSLWDGIVQPADAIHLQELFERISHGQQTIRIEHSWVNRFGDDRWIAWTYSRLWHQDDAMSYIVGTGIDVTERRAVEQKNQQLMLRLQQLATTDALTKVANRHQLTEMGAFLIGSASANAPLSILMLDVDHFKAVNDTYGHAVGDDVLRYLADCLRDVIRASDVLGRYGGEEFVILLPSTTKSAAQAIAERARRIIADTPIQTTAGAIHLTISIGVHTIFQTMQSFDQVLQAADTALYEAKALGRNQVIATETAYSEA